MNFLGNLVNNRQVPLDLCNATYIFQQTKLPFFNKWKKQKTISKVKRILSNHSKEKATTNLSFLPEEDAYKWILWVLRIFRNYDISTVKWDSLIENYHKETNILETEIQKVRSEQDCTNKGQKINGETSQNERINDELIYLAIEYLFVHPLLRNFRNDDKIQEKLLLLKNKPETHSQRIAQLKSRLRYIFPCKYLSYKVLLFLVQTNFRSFST